MLGRNLSWQQVTASERENQVNCRSNTHVPIEFKNSNDTLNPHKTIHLDKI